MLISVANATTDIATTAPSAGDTFWMNMGLIGVMFVLFYVLLIRPQQKRLQEQRSMLDTLKKGDGVVTSGGLVGTVSKIISDTEVEIDLGSVKVVALRYTIQTKMDDAVKVVATPAKTEVKPAAVKPAEKVAKAPKAAATKKVAKTATVKKAAPKKTAKAKAAPKKTAGRPKKSS